MIATHWSSGFSTRSSDSGPPRATGAARRLNRLPSLEEDTMPILTRLREFLETNKVPYSVHSHPQAFTAQEIAALEHVAGRNLAKVVMVKRGDDLVMLVVPADHRVDLERVRRVLGREVRLATEVEFRDAFPDCDVGAMPPFGNLFAIPVYVDHALKQDNEIVFNAGTHTLTARLAFDDFVRLSEPRMADFAVKG